MDRALSDPSSASALFSMWVSKSVKLLKVKGGKDRVCGKRFNFDGMLVNNSLYCVSPNYIEAKMEAALVNGNEIAAKGKDKSPNFSKGLVEEESGECSSSSEFLASEVTLNYEISSSEGSSSSPSLGWPLHKNKLSRCGSCSVSEEAENPYSDKRTLEKQGSCHLSEIDMMKERFSKLLLGEDMSGCGNGVSTALAISNAVTNLYATLFGQVWRLEPLQQEKKFMWRREMHCLLCVSDHIVELIPSWQTFPDGTKLEIMTSRPRSDLYINLPALQKLDNMLLDILDGFKNAEFWYVDQGILAPEADGSSSFRKLLPHQEDKWWLPVPRVPPGGLSEEAKTMLHHRRDCTNQILKAAKAINNAALAEMGIPDSYLESLPKNGKASLGELIYRYINSDQFSPECLLGCLDMSSEHHALEIANRVEAAAYVWRRKMGSKPLQGTHRSGSKSSWELVKDFVSDADKRELLADRAESLLLCLKQRFPGLPQTTLDTSKIQYNKDVGKSILESYSRVLESLAFNIVARIDDLLYVDDLSAHSDQLVKISKVGTIKQESSSSSIAGIAAAPFATSTPYRTAFSTPSFSPLKLISPVRGGRSPFIENCRHPLSVRRMLLPDHQMTVDAKGKETSSSSLRSSSFSSSKQREMMSFSPSRGSSRRLKEAISIPMDEPVQDE